MSVLSSIPQEKHRTWMARLEMSISNQNQRSVLEQLKHYGPLRIQRPFYPSSHGACHLYLLHPPGGMVSGDSLDISLNMAASSQALVTTPSAGKIYRGDDSAQNQYQRSRLTLENAAELEWFPQETIVFNGARGELHTEVQLQKDAKIALWDIVCLGRPASAERFEEGFITQSLQICIDSKCRYKERNRFLGGSQLLQAPWGLAGHTISGSMVISAKLDQQQMEAIRETAQATQNTGICALSQIEDLLLVRYLGASAEHCKSCFEAIWKEIRSDLWGTHYIRPRIWNT